MPNIDYKKELELYYEAKALGKEAVSKFMAERFAIPDYDWVLIAANIDDDDEEDE